MLLLILINYATWIFLQDMLQHDPVTGNTRNVQRTGTLVQMLLDLRNILAVVTLCFFSIPGRGHDKMFLKKSGRRGVPSNS